MEGLGFGVGACAALVVNWMRSPMWLVRLGLVPETPAPPPPPSFGVAVSLANHFLSAPNSSPTELYRNLPPNAFPSASNGGRTKSPGEPPHGRPPCAVATGVREPLMLPWRPMP